MEGVEDGKGGGRGGGGGRGQRRSEREGGSEEKGEGGKGIGEKREGGGKGVRKGGEEEEGGGGGRGGGGRGEGRRKEGGGEGEGKGEGGGGGGRGGGGGGGGRGGGGRGENPAVATATRLGVSFFGSRILRVRGRSSGLWRETPVNLLTLDGDRYLVAPRGETQWVRNLRAVGGGELRVGRRIEAFRAEEIAAADKNPILRAYLKRWRWEVGAFFGGVRADSPEEAVTAEAHRHPIFRIAAA